jgi:hypothetical protein
MLLMQLFVKNNLEVILSIDKAKVKIYTNGDRNSIRSEC